MSSRGEHALDLAAHTAGKEIKQHLVIGNERPERIFECSRFVFLDHKMSKPCKGVAADKTQRKVVPGSSPNEPNEQCHSDRGANVMQCPCRRFAVLGNVEIPKFRIAVDHFRFRYLPVKGYQRTADRREISQIQAQILETSCNRYDPSQIYQGH